MPKMSEYVKTFKVKEGNKDKDIKLMFVPHRQWEAVRKI